MNTNTILKTDSYKTAHWLMMQPGVTNTYDYLEFRIGGEYDEAVFFGLQAILMKQLVGIRIDLHTIAYAKPFVVANMGPGIFQEDDWKYIATKHNGYLPVRICAVPEGSVNPLGAVLMTVEITDPKCAWLVGYLEGLLQKVWYGSVVATLSREVKKDYAAFMTETLGNTLGIEFMLHDFGYRGVSSEDSAGIGGLAHLVNFKGTDTLPALVEGVELYRANLADLGFSVPASEHSIMTALGREGESTVVGQLINKFPTGIVSVVADSYDIYNFVTQIMGVDHYDAIMAREGKFVVRPDSPTPQHPEPGEQMVWIFSKLAAIFGYTVNEQGFYVLDDHVGVLWGDGIDRHGIHKILVALRDAGFATTNVSGMGGGLLQKVNRDVERAAMKCSAQERDGVWYDIEKMPLDITKRSKAGRFDHLDLPLVFENGRLKKHYTFDEVRANAAI